MKRACAHFVLAGLVALAAGCVDRRISITSEPSGALVFLNDSEVGRTPLEVNFTYFGTYDVRLRKEGYEPLITTATAPAPPHEWPVIDFFALLVPGTKRTRIEWHFELQQAQLDEGALLERAHQLRLRFEGVEQADPETTPDG